MFRLYKKDTNELVREDANRFLFDSKEFYLEEEDSIQFRRKLRHKINNATTIDDIKEILLKII